MKSDLSALYPDHLARLAAAYDVLLAAHGLDAVVIAAGSAVLRNRFDDQHWPLAITPAFAHWLPLPEPDAVLVIRAGRRPQLLRVVTDDYWESAPASESD